MTILEILAFLSFVVVVLGMIRMVVSSWSPFTDDGVRPSKGVHFVYYRNAQGQDTPRKVQDQ